MDNAGAMAGCARLLGLGMVTMARLPLVLELELEFERFLELFLLFWLVFSVLPP